MAWRGRYGDNAASAPARSTHFPKESAYTLPLPAGISEIESSSVSHFVFQEGMRATLIVSALPSRN